ncbi:MAG: DUF1080 domain-containing protein [Planctomycetes bacterium]|nr:DUF1080 domain-containing protein [Planctomycetota bacterium]
MRPTTLAPVLRPLLRQALLAATLAATLAGCASAAKPGPGSAGPGGWRSLFDGKTLAGWTKADFIESGEPRVEDGKLILPAGARLTAVRREDMPLGNYEVELEAMRVDGQDFFCGITFPVAGSHASLIVGGWGGMVCGISSLEGMDASENETTRAIQFESGKWYRVRLRVTDRIEAWIDDEKIADVETAGRKIGTRHDIDPAKPFGLASWRTTAALRGIRWREAAAAPQEPAKP